MTPIKLAVVFGGCSTEYEVSLKSAASVISNLDPQKYALTLVGITRKGDWYLYTGAIQNIAEDRWFEDSANCFPAMFSPSRSRHELLVFDDGDICRRDEIDLAFPILHGKNGEDGTIQGLLELAGIPFVGCKTLSSAVCMDKEIAHILAEHAGIPVPPFFTATDCTSREELLQNAMSLGYPLFVKPANAGSSIGITKAYDSETLLQGVQNALFHDRKVVIEQAVEGFEVGCAVIGNETLFVGEVDEIELRSGFFNYKEKYTLETSKIHLPARLDEFTKERIKKTAEQLYRILNCEGYARVDLFYTPGGKIVFNEINTIPGFTAQSRFPKMLSAKGISYPEVLDRIIALSLTDQKQ